MGESIGIELEHQVAVERLRPPPAHRATVCVSAPAAASPRTDRARAPTNGIASSTLCRYAVEASKPTKRCTIDGALPSGGSTVMTVSRVLRWIVDVRLEPGNGDHGAFEIDVGVDLAIAGEHAQLRIRYADRTIGTQLIGGRPEKNEVPLGQPVEHRIELGVSEHSFVYRSEVGNDQVHRADGVDEIASQPLGTFGITAVDLDLGPRLDLLAVPFGPDIDGQEVAGRIVAHAQHRVNEEMGGNPIALQQTGEPYRPGTALVIGDHQHH